MINGVKVRPGPKLVFVEFGMFPIYPRAVFLFDKWIYISSMIWSYFRILKDLFIDLILFRFMWRSIFSKAVSFEGLLEITSQIFISISEIS